MEDNTTISESDGPTRGRGETNAPETLALVIAWSKAEPSRIGEIALIPRGRHVLGRGDNGVGRLHFVRQRPGEQQPTGPIASQLVSRNQLELMADDHALLVQNVGHNPLSHNGQRTQSARVVPGDTLTFSSMMLLCVRRPAWLPAWDFAPHAFGAPDAHGIIGESAAAWALRRKLSIIAARDRHALITGPSGSGKELAARVLHALSPRASKQMITRNAASIPEGLVDAELFGNIKNYPNPGMVERQGLFGEADGSTLFLDELAELPHSLQVHLLRVLDDGEYSRLGEAKPRRAQVRVIGATNRPLSALKEDVLARFPLRVELTGLDDRREDISLLVRQSLLRVASEDLGLRRRLYSDGDTRKLPHVSLAFLDHLLRFTYTTNARELDALLWQAILDGPPGLELSLQNLPPAASGTFSRATSSPTLDGPAATTETERTSLDPQQIQTVLDEHNGSLERSFKALGLASRHVLSRLIRKHGLAIRKLPGR